MGRRSAADAADTREAIIRAAADIASQRGLDGVTIGALADHLGLSKSGIMGHFHTKEELQLATLEYAFDVFRQSVWEPVKDLPAGLPRLLALCESWTAYAENPGFSGGCCVTQITFEFDARAGRVHDEIARALGRWRATLMADVAHAVGAGDLPEDADPAQVAFGLDAIASGMSPARMLQGDTETLAWARRAMHAVLGVRPEAVTRASA